MRSRLVIALLSSLLITAACGGTTVGHACSGVADCQAGQVCLSADTGGYCTKGCTIEGDVHACPIGSVCATQDAGLYCSVTCGGTSDCRASYTCNPVASSTSKACVQ